MVIVCSRIKSRLAKTVPSPHSAFLPAEGIPLVSCVAVDELCGRGQAMWPWISCIPLVSCTSLASCAAVGKLCGRGVFGCSLAFDLLLAQMS
jgi:hypothetical protein